MITPAIDIPRLSDRIQEIVQTYDPSIPEKNYTIKDPNMWNNKELIRNLIRFAKAFRPEAWKASGLRMETSEALANCVAKVQSKATLMGEGFFGKVFNMPVHKCMKNIPPGVKRVGIKVEAVKGSFDNQLPERVKSSSDIAKRMGALGIGPKLYDIFYVLNSEGVTLVKVYDLIDGKAWKDMVWKSPAEKSAAIEKLGILIHKMNKAGVIHNDLANDGNVMVDKHGRVYIIDFDLAVRANTMERNRLEFFKQNPGNGDWFGAPQKLVDYVYTTLVSERTIKLSLSEDNGLKLDTTTTKRSTRKAKK
jgi:predicted Ser/Thr protein kinase